MKDQLKKTFSDSSWHIPITDEGLIKTENALLAAGFDNQELTDSYLDNEPNTTEYYPFTEQQPDDLYRENNDDSQSCIREHNTFYSRRNYRPVINHPLLSLIKRNSVFTFNSVAPVWPVQYNPDDIKILTRTCAGWCSSVYTGSNSLC